MTRNNLLRFFVAVVLCIALVGFGCSRSPVVPVSGKVIFTNREQPEVCRITFVPAETSEGVRGGGAEMDADGSYKVSPFKGVEGLLPGKYIVRVSYFDLKKNGNPDRDSDWRERTFEAESLVVEEGSNSVQHDIEIDSKK